MLPVCMRLGQEQQHRERRELLRSLPYDESIHLCLMSDGPPVPGDDAFELCRHLAGPKVNRRHVSVVDGGWPAVEKLAGNLGLTLMPADGDNAPQGLMSTP